MNTGDVLVVVVGSSRSSMQPPLVGDGATQPTTNSSAPTVPPGSPALGFAPTVMGIPFPMPVRLAYEQTELFLRMLTTPGVKCTNRRSSVPFPTRPGGRVATRGPPAPLYASGMATT